MPVLHFSAEADAAGMIHLYIPVGASGNFDVQVVVNPKPTPGNAPTTPEERGWPPGFFERTYGSIDDETFMAPERGRSDPEELFE